MHTKDLFFMYRFRQIRFSELSENDFVYCDPPYLITTGTYNDGKRGFTGWNEKQECKLLKILDMLHERGISFALSNVLIHRGRRNTTLLEWIEHRGYTITYLNKIMRIPTIR